MQRQILTLNTIPYLVEYTNYKESKVKHTKNLVFLRKYDIINDVAQDKEIMFIDVEDYKEIFKLNEEGKLEDQHNIVYPYINNDYESYIDGIINYLPDSNIQSLKWRNVNDNIDTDLNTDYYNVLYNKNSTYNLYNCRCDKIRIYKPHNRKNINSIISISSYINGIHFNFYCKKYDSHIINVGKEIKVENNTYYEYIEFYIPSIDDLFSQSNVFYNEDLNLHQDIYIWKEDGKQQIKTKFSDEDKTRLQMLIMPYSIDKLCNKEISCEYCDNINNCKFKELRNLNVKTFFYNSINADNYINSEFNVFNSSLILTLSHYDNIDNESSKYLSNACISPASIMLFKDNSFSLKAKIDFNYDNNSVISVISNFEYPEIFDNDEKLTVEQAYFRFNKISNPKEYYDYNEYDYDESFLDKLDDELVENLKFNSAGYVIEMSLDIKFDQIFYRRCIGTTEIDDFTFNIDNIFSDWNEYPEAIFVRTMFIDKPLSKILISNTMALTKEKFKYCINDTSNIFRINLNSTDMIFLDKINCTIKKYDVTKENVVINGGNTNSKIVYKTVFFKTHDLQNIKLRDNVTQNVGINLEEYLSKVADFKLKIDEYEFVESARNNIYVIFTIPTSKILNKSGKYDIVNALDDTYISSGNYTIS